MAVDGEFDVPVGDGLSFRYAGTPDDIVARHLFWGDLRRWEGETWPHFIALARQARGFLDVGAFTGTYSLVACAVNPEIRCVAFEPVPAVFDRLAVNVALNGWHDRVDLVNAAAGEAVGQARFHVPGRALPDTGFLEGSWRMPEVGSDGRTIELPVTTVPAALEPDFPVDLVKVDVEDAEASVFRGMAGLLAMHRPAIVVELHSWGGFDEVADILDGIGYDYFHLSRLGKVPVARPDPVESDPCRNFLCVPRR
jgi:FkbM family methyltransferase